LKEQDKLLEFEHNAQHPQPVEQDDHDDDTSSDGSFIDATQQNPPEDVEQQDKVPTPVRVQRDMEFLNNSWANMNENVQADADLLAALENPSPSVAEQPVDDAGFQMILCK
jgi:hypothetical protein